MEPELQQIPFVHLPLKEMKLLQAMLLLLRVRLLHNHREHISEVFLLALWGMLSHILRRFLFPEKVQLRQQLQDLDVLVLHRGARPKPHLDPSPQKRDGLPHRKLLLHMTHVFLALVLQHY
jgi:hypothetical protein